jgi:hypothetical protein
MRNCPIIMLIDTQKKEATPPVSHWENGGDEVKFWKENGIETH